MSNSKLIISASGVRGIVGPDFDPEFALSIGKAFGAYLKTGSVIIGSDSRRSGMIYKSAVISGLLMAGIDVLDIGIVPTPTCQQLIGHYDCQGAVVITASHNPAEWNGIKLMNAQGSFLTQEEFEVFNQVLSDSNFTYHSWDKVGKYRVIETALDTHIDHIMAQLDCSPIQNSGLRVLIDPNNGAACEANQKLLSRLGVQFDLLNGDPTLPFSHNPEPLEKNVSQIKEALSAGEYDIGFVQDADADRLVILDENGRFIGEDYSLGFCIDHVLRSENATEETIVVNLSTSQLIHDIAARYQSKIHYTKIGETHVTQGLRDHQAIVGGEGNGGVIYPKIGWGRDSLTGITLALLHLATTQKTVSEIVSTYPSYVMIRDKISLNSREEVLPLLESLKTQFKDKEQDHQDGVKVYLDSAWIHARPSNTEPIARIFIEAKTQEIAEDLLKDVRSLCNLTT